MAKPNLLVNFLLNPTLLYSSQFTAPFNILPDVIYTNPTKGRVRSFQFQSNEPPNPTYLGNPTTTTNKIGVSVPPKPNTNVASTEFQVNSYERDKWIVESAPATNVSFWQNLAGGAISIASGIIGVPQVAQSGQQLLSLASGLSPLSSQYATLELKQMKPLPGVKYADFRQRRVLGNGTNDRIGNAAASTLIRLDGAAAALRSRNGRTALYAASTANPYGGVYAVFNLNGVGTTGFGWGSQDDPYAIRNDFTLRSHVATRWVLNDSGSNPTTSVGTWKPLATNAPERYIPFRGDRVNVIDFGQRIQKSAYLWNPTGDKENPSKLDLTQDFIKFYLTGPKILPAGGEADDIIVFRATLNSLSDSFNANWTPVTMLGRADANQHYTGYSRDVSLDFVVYATDRDELKPIWRKLNALAGYTAPIYNNDFSLGAPWMRITVGDLFRQQPVILTSLSYTLIDGDTTWEINIEDDPEMMQVPHKVSVSCQFTYIGNELPQHGGRFYSLAKQFDSGSAIRGNDNWLSDFKTNSDIIPEVKITATGKSTAEGRQDLSVTNTNTNTKLDQIDNYVLGDNGPQVNIGA